VGWANPTSSRGSRATSSTWRASRRSVWSSRRKASTPVRGKRRIRGYAGIRRDTLGSAGEHSLAGDWATVGDRRIEGQLWGQGGKGAGHRGRGGGGGCGGIEWAWTAQLFSGVGCVCSVSSRTVLVQLCTALYGAFSVRRPNLTDRREKRERAGGGGGGGVTPLPWTPNTPSHAHMDFVLNPPPPPADGKVIKAQIWDTAGQERYRAITSA
jgi:hypothetical protein